MPVECQYFSNVSSSWWPTPKPRAWSWPTPTGKPTSRGSRTWRRTWRGGRLRRGGGRAAAVLVRGSHRGHRLLGGLLRGLRQIVRARGLVPRETGAVVVERDDDVLDARHDRLLLEGAFLLLQVVAHRRRRVADPGDRLRPGARRAGHRLRLLDLLVVVGLRELVALAAGRVRVEPQQGDVQPAELGALDALVVEAVPGAAAAVLRLVRLARLGRLQALRDEFAQCLLREHRAGSRQRRVRGGLDGARRGVRGRGRGRGGALLGGVVGARTRSGAGAGVRGTAGGGEHHRDGGCADKDAGESGGSAYSLCWSVHGSFTRGARGATAHGRCDRSGPRGHGTR